MMRYIFAAATAIATTTSPVGAQEECTSVLECVQIAVEAAQLANERLDQLEKGVQIIQTGYIEPNDYETSKFRDPADSIDANGCISGDRAHRGIRSRTINFPRPFSSPPTVVLGITEMTSTGPVRLTMSHSAVTAQSFKVRITTYCDTKVYDIKVHWTAHGN